MSRYTFAPAADRDLADIWLYTAETWSRDQADRYAGLIVDTCGRLASGEVRGRPIPEIGATYLKVTVGAHLVIYRRSGDAVLVLRVLHRRMDIAAHFDID